jgi:hypothetical protein
MSTNKTQQGGVDEQQKHVGQQKNTNKQQKHITMTCQ